MYNLTELDSPTIIGKSGLTKWPFHDLTLSFPPKYLREKNKDIYKEYQEAIKKHTPLIEPKLINQDEVRLLFICKNKEHFDVVREKLEKSAYNLLYWRKRKVVIDPIYIENEWDELQKIQKRLISNRDDKGTFLRSTLDVWKRIHKILDKNKDSYDALILETPVKRPDLPYKGVGNVLYGLSELFKLTTLKPLQHISEESIDSILKGERIYIDANIHHYIFHALGGVLFDIDRNWVFEKDIDFTILAFDLSAPVHASPTAASLRFLGVVVTLKNSFVEGFARIFTIPIAKTYIIDFTSILANIHGELADNVIILADGITPDFTYNTIYNYIKNANKKLFYLDIIKNVRGKFLEIDKKGNVKRTRKGYAITIGKDFAFVQPHTLRRITSKKRGEYDWRTQRSIAIKLRGNDIFKNGLHTAIKLIRAIQASSQKTYEFRYIKIPPIISKADRLSEIQQILSQFQQTIPTNKKIPLGLIG